MDMRRLQRKSNAAVNIPKYFLITPLCNDLSLMILLAKNITALT